MLTDTVEGRLGRVFDKAFGRHAPREASVAEAMPEWDSLSHIKLIMELEAEFEIDVPPGDIPKLYSEFRLVLDYVRSSVRER